MFYGLSMTYTNNYNNGEVLQAVEPERHPLRWLWWLLAAAILAGIIWALAAACTRNTEPVEVVTPVVPTATIEPTDAPLVDDEEPVHPDETPAPEDEETSDESD